MSIAEENIIILLQAIAKQLFPNDFSETEETRSSLMDKIRLRNMELHDTLKDFILAYESLEFIASDYQLRLKAADLWNSQKEMFVKVLEQNTESLLQYTNSLKIDIEKELAKITD